MLQGPVSVKHQKVTCNTSEFNAEWSSTTCDIEQWSLSSISYEHFTNTNPRILTPLIKITSGKCMLCINIVS